MSNQESAAAVLVIDDDEDLLAEMSDTISWYGYPVYAASSAEMGLQIIEKNEHIDVVVIDEILPDMRGTDLYMNIKEKFSDRRISAILLTGYADIDVCIKALRIGFHDFIQKPAEASEIYASLTRAASAVKSADPSVDDKITNAALRLLRRLPKSESAREDFSLDGDRLAIIAVAYDYGRRNEKLLTKTIQIVTGVPLSSVIRHLDELCDLGLTERQDDPSDRRRTLIAITAEGSAYFTSVTEGLRNAITSE